MLLGGLQEAHGVLRVTPLLLDVHLQGGAMHEIEVLQLLVALGAAAVEDLSASHGVGEGVVGDEVIKLLALLLLDLIHESADLVLEALAVGSELLLVHGVPTVGRVWAHRLADGDVVAQLENLEGGIVVRLGDRILLNLARVDGIALHTGHGVEGLVKRGVQDATSWGELALPLPVVRADMEHHDLRRSLILDEVAPALPLEDRQRAQGADERPHPLLRSHRAPHGPAIEGRIGPA
mmetsp:Transcript_77743/g.166691  ORF Transcript_77743/g.166691 Transcript_77743/m.166691 type:complete len:236 (+) Transcript_77743:836-1543(+)